jgi:acyl-coenzyme A thioesterase PaaI-like protein
LITAAFAELGWGWAPLWSIRPALRQDMGIVGGDVYCSILETVASCGGLLPLDPRRVQRSADATAHGVAERMCVRGIAATLITANAA